MNPPIIWQIPPSNLRWLAEIPTDRPVAVLMRHSVRGHLPPLDAGYTLPITEDGQRLAEELGTVLHGRLRSLHSSPILRCVQTADALARGATVELPVRTDKMLGDPGVFVLDDQLARNAWVKADHEGVMAHIVSTDEPWLGLAVPDAAARFLVQRMLGEAGDDPGLHVFVTHDSLVTATAARMLQIPLAKDRWPWFLECAFFWRDGDTIHSAYKDHAGGRQIPQLCRWSALEIKEFAEREMHNIFGPTWPAHFFFCGGAYKTLLTGRRPRDLDLWAASSDDRKKLIEALLQRGAVELPAARFGQLFQIADRVVEVPLKTAQSSLEELFARFDIGLSAVGVEFAPDSACRCLIHPLALESLTKREVRLLLPLVNRRFVLSTQARLRNYAKELDFVLPAEQEAEIWRVFDDQTADGKRDMVAQLELSRHAGEALLAEVHARFSAERGQVTTR